MDVFGSTLSSKTNKLIADGNIKFENGLKKLDDSIDENRKKIASLILTADKLENKIKLCDNLGGENYEKIENLIKTCDKSLFTLSTLEGEIEKLTLRVNYLDVVTLEDSTIATAQPTTRT